MAVFYNRLWSLLDKKGITKTEFRKLIDISTVTLAKLSKNEPVSLTILEKICKEFDCRIEDIVEISSNNVSTERWNKIKDEKFYITELFYVLDLRESENALSFVYGYSIESTETVQAKNYIELKRLLEANDLEIWSLTQTITGLTLQKLICYMEQSKTIGEFMKDCNFKFHDSLKKQKKKRLETCFENTTIGQECKNYRSPILLIPDMESSELLQSVQPLHSFGTEPLLSESLVMRHKKELYYTIEGCLDIPKMEIIKSFFQSKGFLIHGIKDLERIGDFEVFFHLVENAYGNDIFEIESIVEKQNDLKKILKGFKITVFSSYLSGKFMLQVTTWNSGNPTSDQTFDLLLEGRDIEKNILVPESSTSIEVRLYDKNIEDKFQLIGYKKTSLMRDISILYEIKQKNVTLVDTFTKNIASNLEKPEKKKAFTLLERYSSFEDNITDTGNDPWRKEFSQVYDDFNQLYAQEMAESYFFEKGFDGNADFRLWLQKQINQKSITEVWLFDQYFDAKSVPTISRAICDSGIKLHIVTDVRLERKEELKETCASLQELLPDKLEIVSFQKNKSILHDRILILCGKQYVPYVYNMSNSLDTMAMHHASIICKLDRKTARKVTEYYFNLYQNEQLEKIWPLNSFSISPKTDANKNEEANKELEDTIAFFNKELPSEEAILSVKDGRILFPDEVMDQKDAPIFKNICNAMLENADKVFSVCNYVEERQKKTILMHIRSHYNTTWREKLIQIIKNGLSKQNDPQKNRGLKVQSNNDFRHILEIVNSMLDFPYEYRFEHRLDSKTEWALQLLITSDFSGYREVLNGLNERYLENPTVKYTVLCYFICYLTQCPENQVLEIVKKCLTSDIQELIAVGIEWSIKRKKLAPANELLKDTPWCNYLYQRMFLTLQVEDCRKKYRRTDNKLLSHDKKKEFREEKMQFLKEMKTLQEQWCEEFSTDLTVEQLKENFDELRMRNCQDVCDLVEKLYNMKKISEDEIKQYLLYCLFDKINRQYKQEDGYLTEQDFQDSYLFFMLLCKYKFDNGITLFLKELTNLQKKFLKALHDVFLESKNYRKWKCYIDSLIWCYFFQLLCEQQCQEYKQWVIEDNNLNVRNQEIHMLLKKYKKTLDKYSVAYQILVQNFKLL